MKVRFNLKDSGGLILLKFRYVKGQLPFVFSTRQHIAPKDWNKKTMRAIIRSATTSPHLADLNSLLQRMEDETLSIYRSNVGRVQLTNDLFRDRLNEVFFNQTSDRLDLPGFMQSVMMKQKRADETLNNYQHTAAILHTFKKDRRASLDMDRIDFEWLDNFKSWCYSKEYATGSVGKFISIIKAAINLARKHNLTDNRHVSERGFSVKKSSGNRSKLALYPHEVAAIAEYNWLSIGSVDGITGERMQRYADVIVAACSTGLRHSDFDKVTKESIVSFRKRQIIQVWTQKSDKPVAIPLDARLRSILEKYNYQLPAMDRSQLLVVGRVVCRLAGIDREIAIRETTGGKTKIVHYPFWQKFSAHVTRRTFARNAYLEDPALLPAIQAILGHASQAQTLDYIDVEGMLTAEHFANRMEQKPMLKAVK